MKNFEVFQRDGKRFIRLLFLGKLENKQIKPVQVEHALEDWIDEEEIQPHVNQANVMALKNGIPGSGIAQLIPVTREDFNSIMADEVKSGASFVDVRGMT